MGNEPRISACVIVLNERAHIVRCAKHLAAFVGPQGEVVFLDTGSTDGTGQALLAAFGGGTKVCDEIVCRCDGVPIRLVPSAEFFAATPREEFVSCTAHNESVMVTGDTDWAFWIDCDEVLPSDDALRLLNVLRSPDIAKYDAIRTWDARTRDAQGNITCTFPRLRLFRKGCGYRFFGFEHPFLAVRNPARVLNCPQVHVFHEPLTHTPAVVADKHNRFRSLLEREGKAQGWTVFRTAVYYARETASLGEHEQALAAYDRALRLKPQGEDLAELYRSQAECYEALGKVQEAIGCLQQSLAVDRKRIEPYIFMARLHERLHQVPQAIAYLVEASKLGEPQMDIMPTNPALYSQGWLMGQIARLSSGGAQVPVAKRTWADFHARMFSPDPAQLLRLYAMHANWGFNAITLDKVRSLARHEKTILNVGFGTGYCSMTLAKAGLLVDGIETDQELVRRAIWARNHIGGGATFRCGDAFKLEECTKGHYDVVFHMGLLEHFTDEQIHELLRQQLARARHVFFSIPSDKTPVNDSFGDERFLSLDQWRAILAPFADRIEELDYMATDWKGILCVLRGDVADEATFTAAAPLRVWEVDIRNSQSYSVVNRELVPLMKECRAVVPQDYRPDIAANGKIEDDLTATPLPFHPSNRAVTITHRWPPCRVKPATGKWIAIQPWEFGSLPKQWTEWVLQPDDIWVYSKENRIPYLDAGVPEERLFTLPLAVNYEHFKPEGTAYKLNTKKQFKFLYVGGLLYRKGFDLAARAFAEAFLPSDDVCFVVKSSGERSHYSTASQRRMLDAMRGDPKVGEIIHVEDYLSADDLASLYRACDCAVFPYRSEGFALPIAEAMACGLPCIVTDAGPVLEYSDPECTVRIPAERKDIRLELETVGTPWQWEPRFDSIVEKMRAAVVQREWKATIGAKAAAHVRGCLSWQKTAELAAKRIEEVAAR